MKKLITLSFIFGFISGLNAQDSLKLTEVQTQYLAEQKILGKKFSDGFYPDYMRMHQLSEKDFITKIGATAAEFDSLLNAYHSRLPKEYAATERLEIKMYFDRLLVEYPYNHEIYTAERPKGYPIIERQIKDDLPLFNDPALLENPEVRRFIQSFLSYKVNARLSKPAYNGLYNKRLYAMWNMLPKYFKDRKCRNYQQYHLLLDHINNNGYKYTQQLYEAFKKENPDTAFVSKLARAYLDSQNDLKDHQVLEYKRIGDYGLDIHIFRKDSLPGKNKKPAIVFFHGGSWSEGQPSWHFAACRKYAEKGWVACSVEYRIFGSQGTLPFAAVMDARSAIRWLREHGDELGLDTGRIVATGNSAGGHLVLAAALATGWNEKTDKLKFSPVPNVLLVNSGVYDLTDEKTAWIRKDLKNKSLVKGISPNELVRHNLPPMLLVHSAADQAVPYPSVQKFVALMKDADNKFEFRTLEKGGHFIFADPLYTPVVFSWRREFLKQLGYPDAEGD